MNPSLHVELRGSLRREQLTDATLENTKSLCRNKGIPHKQKLKILKSLYAISVKGLPNTSGTAFLNFCTFKRIFISTIFEICLHC